MVPDYTAPATAVPTDVPTELLPTQTAESTFTPTPEPTCTPAPSYDPPAPPKPTLVPSPATPGPEPAPTGKPYYHNDYPTSESEIALAESGKAFMDFLRSDPEYSELDLTSKQGYPYLICINSVNNCITVYCADENGQYTRPYLSMVCSAGKRTPMGIYQTKEHYRWHVLMGPCYGQYCTRIVNGILFHSVPYNTLHKYDLRYRSYNRLGTWASHGCIRLAANDAKWIFDNCKTGTTVVIYNYENDPGPLGKPEAIKLDANETWLRGWDPTDPDKYNPWGTEFQKGTTHRSALAQADYNYAIQHGLWDGTINPPEPSTPYPTVEPTLDPSASPDPSGTPDPNITPDPNETPSPSDMPSPSPAPSAAPTPQPPADTPEPTGAPEPTDAPPQTEAPGAYFSGGSAAPKGIVPAPSVMRSGRDIIIIRFIRAARIYMNR